MPTKKDVTTALKKWLKSGGNPTDLASHLRYKTASAIHNWAARGVPERVMLEVFRFISGQRK